jgi:hypothetical protein
MIRFFTIFATAAVLATVAAISQGVAAPPVATPSPGYDARLQEQHRAQSSSGAVVPVAPPAQPRKRHAKRTH